MKKLGKIITINVVIFLSILLVLNFTSVVIYQTYQTYQSYQPIPADPKGSLPNYTKTPWAKKHFEEFIALPTEYKSYIGWRRLEYVGKTITIDSNGLRVTPQHPELKKDAPKVIFLGGSTMWGTGANDANTIPAHFAALSKGDYQSINMAETAYNAFQSYIFLRMQIMQGIVPDIVVSYDGVNELSRLNVNARPFGHARDNQIRNALFKTDGNSIHPELAPKTALTYEQFFIGPIKLFSSKMKQKLSGDIEQNIYDLSSERITQVAKELLESWKATKQLANSNGARFIGILQPNAGIGNPNLSHLTLDQNILTGYKHLYPAIIKLLQSEEYSGLAQDVSILVDAFDNEDYIYIDFCHVSPNGNQIIAKKIYSIIKNK